MRERRSFAERSRVLSSSEVRRKYFLVYEGKNTEAVYFDGINEYRSKIGIDPLVEFIPVIRSYSEENWSNPKKILDRLQRNIREAEEGTISCETLLNWIMEYFFDEGIIRNNRPAMDSMWAKLEMICEEKLQVQLSDCIADILSACTQIAEELAKETEWVHIIDDIPKIIEHRAITYDKALDKICFIIDRDRESFISKPGNDQYHYVLDKCRENGFGFYLSNPCFELWLLMHFDEVNSLDAEKLLKNPRVTSRRRYIEQELRKLLPGYSKSRYPVAVLMQRVDKAINNEKLYCEDEDELEYRAGSRVGLLLEEMKSNEGAAGRVF